MISSLKKEKIQESKHHQQFKAPENIKLPNITAANMSSSPPSVDMVAINAAMDVIELKTLEKPIKNDNIIEAKLKSKGRTNTTYKVKVSPME